MKFKSKILSITLSALMMLGSAIGIKPAMQKVNALDSLTYTYVFSTKPSTGNSINLSGVNWNISGEGIGSYNSNNYAGVQIGTSSAVGSITLSSSSSWGEQEGDYYGYTKVESVIVWANSGGTTTTASVSVDGVTATSDGTNIVKNSTAKSYQDASKIVYTPEEGHDSGVVTISLYGNKPAGYLCAIEVVCEKVPTTEPSCCITALADNNLKVGSSIQLTETHENVTGSVTWASSNIDVATISSAGLLTAVGMGTTNITAKYNEITSSPLTITVYPDNENIISASLALDICDFVGESATPYEYTLVGEVSNISGKTFDVTDSTGTIKVYNTKSISVSEGDEVKVTGKLTKYQNETNEISPTSYIAKHCDVTFMNGSSQYDLYEDMWTGDKIVAPTDPIKTNCTFKEWQKENGEAWDFDVDTLTGDLTLYAAFENDALNSLQSDLDCVESFFSLGYTYTKNSDFSTGEKDLINASFIGSTDSSYVSWSAKVGNASSAVYAGNSAGGAEYVQLNNSSSNKGIFTLTSGGIASSVSVKWNSTKQTAVKTLDIYGSHSAYSTASDLYGDKKGTKIGSITFGSDTSTVLEGEYEYIGIRANDGAVYLDEIEIAWNANHTIDSSDFRFRVGVEEKIAHLDNAIEYSYGIEVATSSKTKKYEFNSESPIDNGVVYQIIDLGDALNNPERMTDEFTIRAYVEIDGDFIYSTLTKTHSMKSLIAEYYADVETKDAVEDCYNLLTILGI